jgi:hypothetical protein
MSNVDWYRKNAMPHIGVLPHTPNGARPVPRFQPDQSGHYQPVYPGQEQQPQGGPGYASDVPYPTSEAPVGQFHVGDGVRSWKGTRASRENTGNCPDCGSGNYFTQLVAGSEGGGESGKKSLGHCFDCGSRPGGRGQPTPQTTGVRLGNAINEKIPVYQSRSAAPLDPASGGMKVFARLAG